MAIKDLTDLDWRNTKNNGSSYGCLYKATMIENGTKYYYKCSTFYQGQGVFGDEALNEVICSRYLTLLGFDIVHYILILGTITLNGLKYTTYVCKSKNYYINYDNRISLEDYHSLSGNKSVFDIISELNISKDIQRMMVADFLILNRDRHGANIELMIKGNKYKLAPLFDNGLSLLAPYPSKLTANISQFDVMGDYPVNNYIGTRSLYQNLGYIRHLVKVKPLTEQSKRKIFYGLNSALPKQYIDTIWNLLVSRYEYAKSIGIIHD